MRKVGTILLDMELLLDELVEHDLQMGDILALNKAYLEIHQPECIEQYEDGTSPVYKYGHKEEI